ncbi:MAG: peroxiredoxin family protein [Nitrospinales bacterium]
MKKQTRPGEREYNYARFDPACFTFHPFSGPKAGEPAVDFTVTDLRGNPVRLSDFRGKTVALETISTTCPMYIKGIAEMNRLAERFPEAVFLTLYVREAHPGSRTPAHRSLEEKIACAKQLPALEQERRTILVDDLEGSAHRAYGGLPNMIYVIDPGGTVIFRSDWRVTAEVEKVLTAGADAVFDKEHFEPLRPSLRVMLRTFLRGGWDAIWDFVTALPKLLALRMKGHI